MPIGIRELQTSNVVLAFFSFRFGHCHEVTSIPSLNCMKDALGNMKYLSWCSLSLSLSTITSPSLYHTFAACKNVGEKMKGR